MQNLIPKEGRLYYKRLDNFLKLFTKKRREVDKKSSIYIQEYRNYILIWLKNHKN